MVFFFISKLINKIVFHIIQATKKKIEFLIHCANIHKTYEMTCYFYTYIKKIPHNFNANEAHIIVENVFKIKINFN